MRVGKKVLNRPQALIGAIPYRVQHSVNLHATMCDIIAASADCTYHVQVLQQVNDS